MPDEHTETHVRGPATKRKPLEFSFSRWFITLAVSFVIAIVIYMLMHICPVFKNRADFEYAVLDKSQQEQISHIYLGKADSAFATGPDSNHGANRIVVSADLRPADSATHNRALLYLDNEFNNKLDTVQLRRIKAYLYSCNRHEAVHFWSHERLRIKSYFWLVGPQVYYEIIFWTIFGVISSLIFRMGNVYRNSTSDPSNPHTIYDPTDVPAHLAKIVYAPICTLIVILGYNYFKDDSTMVDIESSKGVVVFSFFAGFYSQRVMAFMDRIKDVILPNSSNSDLPSVNKVITRNVSIRLSHGSERVVKVMAANEIGFGKASVTLENINSKAVYTAVAATTDPVKEFKAVNLPVGIYTVRAQWQEVIGSETFKGFDRKSVTLSHIEETVEITLV